MKIKVINPLKVLKKARKQKKILVAGVFLAIVASTSAFALHSSRPNTTQINEAPVTQNQTKAVVAEKKEEKPQPKKQATKLVANTTPVAAPTYTPAAPPAPVKKNVSLIVGPSYITVKAGGPQPKITVTSSDGKGLNMPSILGSGPIGTIEYESLTLRPTWTGAFSLFPNVKPGTYTKKIFAQDANAREYWGTITVKIVP